MSELDIIMRKISIPKNEAAAAEERETNENANFQIKEAKLSPEKTNGTNIEAQGKSKEQLLLKRKDILIFEIIMM